MKNKMNINTFIAEYAIIIIFIVLFAAMSIFAPNFLTGSNIANVLRQVSINGICAIGMTFVILTGGIDLSVGAIIGVSGVLTAMMMINNVNPIIASLISLALCTYRVCNRACYQSHRDTSYGSNYGNHDFLTRRGVSDYGRNSCIWIRFTVCCHWSGLCGSSPHTGHHTCSVICGRYILPVKDEAQQIHIWSRRK